MENTKIVITGATGFLGSNLTERLSKEHASYAVFDRKKHDFLKPETFKDLIRGADIIFHLAAAIDQTPEGFDFNVTSTNNLLKIASKVAPKCRIIFASSFAVYKTPQKGELVDEKFKLEPGKSYGLSKLKCEQLLEADKKVESISLRLTNIYGPHPKPVKHSVISNFINLISSGKVIQLHGDGLQEIDFLFIDDAVDALLLAAAKPSDQLKKITPAVINICSGEAVSLIKLVSLIEDVLGKKTRMEFVPVETGHGGFWKGDNTLAQKILNWQPKTSITEGLQLTISRSKTVN